MRWDEDRVVRELSAAVERSPEALELRLHLAGLLADKGRYAEALSHCSVVLTRDAGNANALGLLQRRSAALVARRGEGFACSSAEGEVPGISDPAFVDAPADVVDEGDFDVL